jgi:quercetin dioxygenase-like cupin family protein
LKIIKADDGSVYEAPNHFNMWGVRKFGLPEGAKALSVSVSEFLPNGGATMSSSDKERVYVVLRGSITVKGGNGDTYTLDEEDMIYIAPGENREMLVNGICAARVLVIIANC